MRMAQYPKPDSRARFRKWYKRDTNKGKDLNLTSMINIDTLYL